MKKIFLAAALLLSVYVNGQTVPDFDLIKLEKTADYKAAEPFAFQTVVYLLSTPVGKDNSENRLKSVQFLVKWMSGTPDYSFVMDETTAKIGGDNKDIFGIYMAAMIKYSIDNKAMARDSKQVKLNAISMLLDYCENKNNHVKMSKQLKKLSEAKAKGTLEQAL